jgi:predicted ATPase
MSIVTFLFTDIEGSTRRWEADPDAMRAALVAHDELMQEVIENHEGSLFKHTGDGVCAAFSSPRSAVDAAVAAQRKLELPVRMGIATGEAELRGDDYFGSVLNRAARVMAAGHGGQILLDGATAELLTGVELHELGPRRLRDITKPVNLFQVSTPDLRTDFPPLRTLETAQGNLRPPATSFFGRDTALADLQTALKAHRLVTLTGPGGVGKTRLALEAGARLAHEFTDGAWIIELAPVTDAAAVPEAVAAVFGITQQPGMNVAESVASALEGRSRLLVFDNCEHVLDAAADMIEKILDRSGTTQIVATSREGMRLAEERLWPVPSLDVDSGVDSAAAALFIERAEAVVGDLSLTDDGPAIAEICRRLDGIPLAIELAAARLMSMSVTDMREHLDDRFRLLVGARRGLERHQTLRHAVGWSYDLLDTDEKALLRRCSVFAGGFDLAGAQAVTGWDDKFTVLDMLDSLVRKSILVADRSSGHARFSMLETIRQFAEEQLADAGEVESARAAHARYFASREDDVFAMWDSPRQGETYAWLTRELANLRAAFRWAADHDDLDTAAAIAIYSSLLGFYVPQYEPFTWAEELLSPAKAVEHRRLAQLYVMASLCHASGRTADFFRHSEAARAAIDSGRYDHAGGLFEGVLVGGYVTTGHPDRAVELARNAIARNPSDCLQCKMALAIALNFTGSSDEAATIAEDLLAEPLGNAALESFVLLALGWAYRDSDPAKAYDALRQALLKAHDSGNSQIESNIAASLSAMAASHGDSLVAFEYFTFCIRHFVASGSPTFMRTPLAALAVLFDRLGHYQPAATIAEAAATPLARSAFSEIDAVVAHLREVLGADSYESLARTGQAMTNDELSEYALNQIERARAQLPDTREPL